MSNIRILSNNQWTCDNNLPKWAEKGLDCSTAVRAAGFARMFADIDADIIGLQEVTALMARAHMEHFAEREAGYALLWGRDTPILYKTDKFELVDSAYLIYPESAPGFEGSFNNAMTKSYCVAVLRSKEDGKLLIFGTTHLWWMNGDPEDNYYRAGSHEARAYQLGLLMDKVEEFQAKYACPAVILGDLNARRESLAVQSAFARGYVHGRDAATDYVNPGHGYHHCDGAGFSPYEVKDASHAIDHILVKDMPKCVVKRYDIYSEEYYMALSDHLPVFIDVEL